MKINGVTIKRIYKTNEIIIGLHRKDIKIYHNVALTSLNRMERVINAIENKRVYIYPYMDMLIMTAFIPRFIKG